MRRATEWRDWTGMPVLIVDRVPIGETPEILVRVRGIRHMMSTCDGVMDSRSMICFLYVSRVGRWISVLMNCHYTR